jgi:hypothetical protein
MTEIESRVRASLLRVAEETRIPDFHASALKSPEIDNPEYRGVHSERAGTTRPEPVRSPQWRSLIQIIAVGATVVTLTVVGALIQREIGGGFPASARLSGDANHGTIQGRLLISPPMMEAHVSSGSVVITGAEVFTLTVGRSGRFMAEVPSGTYNIVGHSPEYGQGKYDCTTRNDQVVVRSRQTVNVSVWCFEK